MAKKYIDTDTAYEVLTEYYHQKTEAQHKALREALDRVPAADVVEVRHGRWVDVKGYEGLLYRCSECEDKHYKHTTIKYDYCPYCGAKMVKEDE